MLALSCVLGLTKPSRPRDRACFGLNLVVGTGGVICMKRYWHLRISAQAAGNGRFEVAAAKVCDFLAKLNFHN